MSTQDLTQYVAEFEEALSIKLSFSPDGTADVLFNEDILVTLRLSEDDGTITLATHLVNDLPDPLSSALLRDILDLNCVPGMNRGGNAPVIGRNSKNGLLFLYQVLTQSLVKTTSLVQLFTDFIRYTVSIRAHLNGNGNESKTNDPHHLHDQLAMHETWLLV